MSDGPLHAGRKLTGPSAGGLFCAVSERRTLRGTRRYSHLTVLELLSYGQSLLENASRFLKLRSCLNVAYGNGSSYPSPSRRTRAAMARSCMASPVESKIVMASVDDRLFFPVTTSPSVPAIRPGS